MFKMEPPRKQNQLSRSSITDFFGSTSAASASYNNES